jgi:hypothetical protein
LIGDKEKPYGFQNGKRVARTLDWTTCTVWSLFAGDPSLRLKNGCAQDDAAGIGTALEEDAAGMGGHPLRCFVRRDIL